MLIIEEVIQESIAVATFSLFFYIRTLNLTRNALSLNGNFITMKGTARVIFHS